MKWLQMVQNETSEREDLERTCVDCRSFNCPSAAAWTTSNVWSSNSHPAKSVESCTMIAWGIRRRAMHQNPETCLVKLRILPSRTQDRRTPAKTPQGIAQVLLGRMCKFVSCEARPNPTHESSPSVGPHGPFELMRGVGDGSRNSRMALAE